MIEEMFTTYLIHGLLDVKGHNRAVTGSVVVNPILVVCLSLSIFTGFSAAAGVVLAGLGWLAAFAIYSAVGSLSLLAFTMVAQPGARSPTPAQAKARASAKRSYL